MPVTITYLEILIDEVVERNAMMFSQEAINTLPGHIVGGPLVRSAPGILPGLLMVMCDQPFDLFWVEIDRNTFASKVLVDEPGKRATLLGQIIVNDVPGDISAGNPARLLGRIWIHHTASR